MKMNEPKAPNAVREHLGIVYQPHKKAIAIAVCLEI
jgi:hypothetical protein